MRLPNSDKAFISREKLTDYVLSETHAMGKFKAKFFRNLGFDETNVHFFEEVIRTLAKSQEVIDMLSSPYGAKYIIDGKIDTPNGKTVTVRTIWIIEKGRKIPRFITIYPV